MTKRETTTMYADSKPHYALLDGLRGVAALVVIWYHVFEGFATSAFDQRINHGYLAVDFFFILSGFVVGYAYDDRWKRGMTTGNFLKRRLIRLHPMLVLGVLLGAITFCIQGCEQWDGTRVGYSAVMLATLLSLFFIPAYPGACYEVRGNAEMFPLNGPSWSLFFEYIANLLYALFVRKFSTRALAILTGMSGIGLATFAIGNFSEAGHIGVGWTLAGYNFPGGMLRVLFSFSAGLLMSRVFRPTHIKGVFWVCSITLVALLAVPHIGGEAAPWKNGIYDTLCTLFVFPLLVWLGASGKTTDNTPSRVCKFLGDISYPLYIVHYPFMYLFYAWLWKNGLAFRQTWYVAVGIFVGCILLAYAALKLYDESIRRRLSAKIR